MIAPPTSLSERDFEAILLVLSATLRGRWFLDEYARRRRGEDVARLLAAAERIEAQVRAGERRLSALLDDLQPLADARVRARTLQATREPDKATGLERRFAALVELDEQDLEGGLKLFG